MGSFRNRKTSANRPIYRTGPVRKERTDADTRAAALPNPFQSPSMLSNFGRLSEIRVAPRLPLKFRHVAARALVGWYLIIPSSTLPPGIAHKEPFRKWQTVRGFD